MTESEITQVRTPLSFSPLPHSSNLLHAQHIDPYYAYGTSQGLNLKDIKTHKWAIFSCSAITGKNISEGLDWVVGDAQERLFLYNGLGGGSAAANTAKGQLN